MGVGGEPKLSFDICIVCHRSFTVGVNYIVHIIALALGRETKRKRRL